MATQTEYGITWCERTWNPVTGCTAVSEGCANCYAKRQALRLQKMGVAKYAAGFEPMFHPAVLDKITPRQKPKLYFVCSMADLFHNDINLYYINLVFRRMQECLQHRFMVLTKRPEQMRKFLEVFMEPLLNIALGVTCENQARANERLPYLEECSAAYKFVSVEPMLGPVDFDEAWPTWWETGGLDLVICGGESGPGARPMHLEWARDLRDQCASVGVRFHLKQIHIDGKLVKDISQFPVDLQIRENIWNA